MAAILIIHGPNLDQLGRREPALYGQENLASINARLQRNAQSMGHTLRCYQSNDEAALIKTIHDCTDDVIIINPAAFTHTSIALRDALLVNQTPFFEVHLTNIYSREVFRQHSYFSDIAQGVISGLGSQGYDFALQAVDTFVKERRCGHTQSEKAH